MKKLLITVCLSGLLSVPSAVLGAEMAGASLYGSFRTGLSFGSGDASVADFGSRWGIKGSHEVSEGLTASYKYEGKINTTNAESFGGGGHKHPKFAGSDAIAGSTFYNFVADPQVQQTFADDTLGVDDGEEADTRTATAFNPSTHNLDTDKNGNPIVMKFTNEDNMTVTYAMQTVAAAEDDQDPTITYFEVFNSTTTHGHAGVADTEEITADGGQGGRLSYVSLSGGFGTVSLGQIWAASAVHFGFAVDGSYWNGTSGGASGRQGTTVSYSSSAGDVSFQIDKVTGNDDVDEKLEFGASASLGPVGVGLGYWSNADDDASFTGVAISAGAAGVNLTIGLSSEDDTKGNAWDANFVRIAGTAGDTGLSYAVQLSSADLAKHDKNVLILTNSLGAGASLIFEHADPSEGDSSSLLALKVDF